MSPENFAKLPKWAQQEFHILNNRIRRLQDDVALLSGKAGGDRVSIADGLPLGDDANVKFTLGDHWSNFFKVRIDDHPGLGKHLYVVAGETLVVKPEAGNVVRILQHD